MTVELITEDFIGSDYDCIHSCPLAKGLIRLGMERVSVGGSYLSFKNKGETLAYDIEKDWVSGIAGKLISDANNGLNVEYSVTLKNKRPYHA